MIQTLIKTEVKEKDINSTDKYSIKYNKQNKKGKPRRISKYKLTKGKQVEFIQGYSLWNRTQKDVIKSADSAQQKIIIGKNKSGVFVNEQDETTIIYEVVGSIIEIYDDVERGVINEFGKEYDKKNYEIINGVEVRQGNNNSINSINRQTSSKSSSSDTSVGNKNRKEINSKNSRNLQNIRNDLEKFSIKNDSEGNKLTENQQEYFKNSKVVDENGRLPIYSSADYIMYNLTVITSEYIDSLRRLKVAGTYEVEINLKTFTISVNYLGK